ncbi:hypothetical protein AERO9AM_20784 [Aeromicrobium sp. 9AM]|nr:hypothetical protein AERO9AM_20784 [Aeromicrobium sp. 9AM]
MGSGRIREPSTVERSEWQTLAASIFTKTSPGPGDSSSSWQTEIGREVL